MAARCPWRGVLCYSSPMSEDHTHKSPFEVLMGRLVKPVLVAVIVVPSVAWLADWGVWSIQMSRGRGMSQILVSRIVIAPLKGNKEEYYPDGTTLVDCSNSLFPQAGANPCWWVSRHRLIQDR
jgi:hypothetical protein